MLCWFYQLFNFSFFFFFLLLRAVSIAYGGSQARGQIGATAAGPQHRIPAMSATYTTAHGNARSLTYWMRPGIEPATSRFLFGFVSAAPRWEPQLLNFYVCFWGLIFFLFIKGDIVLLLFLSSKFFIGLEHFEFYIAYCRISLFSFQ